MPCGPTSGYDPDEPSDPPPPPPTMTLVLRLRNASGVPHECSSVDIATTNSSGQLTITPIAAGGIVDNGGEISGSISFPAGKSFTANGGCWRVGAPTKERVYGSFPVTLNTNKNCVMIYNSDGEYANMHMECVNS